MCVSEVQLVTGHEGPQGEQRYSSTVSLRTILGVGGQCHDPEMRLGTHCTGGWVGPKGRFGRCGKSRPTGIRYLDRPSRSESLYRLKQYKKFLTNKITRGVAIK